jgi:predicted nucleic acid-binding protein
VEPYWQNLISRIGRPPLYVDTGAILGYFEQGDDRFRDFIDKSAVDYRFVTSTYVIAEAIRFFAKSALPNKFIGPGDERGKQLGLHLLRNWLDEHGVHVICLPEDQFNRVCSVFCKYHYLDCDLTDIVSYVIVESLEQQEILSGDRRHFRELGLLCLP